MAKKRSKQKPPTTPPKGTPKGKGFFTIPALILAGCMLAFSWTLINTDLADSNSYAKAYDARIGFYAEKIDSLSAIGSWKQRLFMRHVANVFIPTWIGENRRATDTILLPPAAYANKYMDANAIWTDPRIFTYFAGFQPIIAYTDTARWSQANAYVVLERGNLYITRPGGRYNIDSLLSVYAADAETAGGSQ